MTEKEKMVQGMLYDANFDKELIADRLRSKELCYEYNMLRPSDEDEHKQILKKLIGKMGENICITLR